MRAVLDLSLNPPDPVISAYQPAQLIIEVGNTQRGYRWYEAVILLHGDISLMPDLELRKARLRVGILHKGEVLRKYLNLYPARISSSDILARVDVVLFAFDRDGVIAYKESASLPVHFHAKLKAISEDESHAVGR